jgi:hypothetical protein
MCYRLAQLVLVAYCCCSAPLTYNFGHLLLQLATSCSTNAAGTVSCSTDTLHVSVASALRMALPAGQYILSTATW